MIGRRAVVGGMAGTAVFAAFGPARAQTPPRVRCNVASPQGLAMLGVYAAGVARMKAMAAASPQSWTFSWYTHATPSPKADLLKAIYPGGQGAAFGLATAAWNTCQPHVGGASHEPFFTFWHRLYVLHLERMIAALTNTPGFAMPYWDYTTPANAALPAQFRMADDPQWGVLFQPNRNVAGNGYADVNAGEPIDRNTPGVLNLDALGEPDFASFNRNLDQNLHGNVHDLVGNGTNMGYVPTAAQDPIFWLHHSNIDRIWYAWTANGGANPTSFADTFTFTNPDGTPDLVALNSVASNAALDYRFDALPPAFNAARRGRPSLGARPAQILLSSAPGRGLRAAPPIRLDAAPRSITLRPLAAGRPLATALGTPGAPARLQLVLRGVSAATPPGTLFGIYLNLPAGVAPNTQAASAFRIGTLNFFDAVAMPGMMGMPRDYVFDLGGAAQTLTRGGRLAATNAVTVAAFGSPVAGSVPTIGGSLDIVRL